MGASEITSAELGDEWFSPSRWEEAGFAVAAGAWRAGVVRCWGFFWSSRAEQEPERPWRNINGEEDGEGRETEKGDGAAWLTNDNFSFCPSEKHCGLYIILNFGIHVKKFSIGLV